jgi:hypothetical protein
VKRLFLAILILAAPFAQASAADAPAVVWEPAIVSSVSATADPGGFTISANLELPQPKSCYTLRIIRNEHPSVQYVVQQARNEKICTEVITPFVLTQHFAVAPVPKSIDISARDEQHEPKHWTVPVTFTERSL